MRERASDTFDAPLWSPTPERAAATQLVGFWNFAVAVGALPPAEFSYDALYRWSIDHPAAFWELLWKFCDVSGEVGEVVAIGLDRMAPPDAALGPYWFPDARLNFADHLLRYRDDREALVSWGEQGRRGSLTYAELYRAVAAGARALARAGVVEGDRVAAYMPNVPEAVVAMLAATALGAVWSSCSPDFGAQGVLDRFGQIEPKVLFVADGYHYNGKAIALRDRVERIVAALPSLTQTVMVPFFDSGREEIPPGVIGWDDWLGCGSAGGPPVKEDKVAPSHKRHSGRQRDALPWVDALPPNDEPISFSVLPFNHPLYVMYSSGTTGLPKCMVHGAGGTLLQHLKEHRLHTDLAREDRVFYFTTCGWMMWNWLVSALAVGATVVLYDGAPFAHATSPSVHQTARRPDLLWQMAEAERLTVFGTSAKYLALCEKEGLTPRVERDLGSLRAILSTGSPLAPPSYDYVYRDVKHDVQLASISGGTDIISCFALGNPAGPVYRGELQVRGLGMRVDVFDANGHSTRGAPGELVCTMPFPSMPVSFWNDPDGAKYRAAYFETYPNAWRHGDWAQLTAHGGLIITGRSDATLNPGGVRIGTAEIYRQVEQLPEIVESLVVGQDVPNADETDVRIVLFVRLREGLTLDDALRDRVRRTIRQHTSPHHVPRVILQVPDIPRTISGKITELAVRDVIHGRPVKNTEALANPHALDHYRDLPELRLH